MVTLKILIELRWLMISIYKTLSTLFSYYRQELRDMGLICNPQIPLSYMIVILMLFMISKLKIELIELDRPNQ